MTKHRTLCALTMIAAVAAASETTGGFSTFGSRWAAGDIPMCLQLASGRSLADGSGGFNVVAATALTAWNAHIERWRFVAADCSTAYGDGDLVNQVFFDSSYYGEAFGRDTVAITTRWTFAGTERIEADVVFNNAFRWDSYRGTVHSSGVWDIRRVALHEFGHVLGLDHPDDHGQHVTAIMNSVVGNLENLTDDDIAGARALDHDPMPREINCAGLAPSRNPPAYQCR